MKSGPKQLTIISGKGGTGKTTVLGSFAALAQNKVVADADVDAANLHLLLHPQVQQEEEFYGAKIAVRDPQKCKQVGECEARCRFDAITTTSINVLACEGCGLCVLACPNNALHLQTISCGKAFTSITRYGPMAHAKLYPGAESSGRLVTMVRQRAEDLALRGGHDLIIIDGPPGIGCTATAAVADVDLAIIVTEPTPAGIHDMQRVAELSTHFGVPTYIIINKADLNAEHANEIRAYAEANGYRVLGELPYDPVVSQAITAGKPMVEYDDGPVAAGIRRVWDEVQNVLEEA